MPFSLLPNLETCLVRSNNTFSCKLPEKFEPDGDIAGHGVFLAFLTGFVLATLAGLFALGWEGAHYLGKTSEEPSKARRTREFLDVLLISLGDTQIVTSIALLITTKFVVGCQISAYHYDLVCKLVLISSASHIGSMAFVHKYFGRSKVLGSIRCALLLCSLIMGGFLFIPLESSKIFPRAAPSANRMNMNGMTDTSLVLPAACFLNHPGQNGTTLYRNFTASPYWYTNFTTVTLKANSSTRFEGTNNTMTRPKNTTLMPDFQPFSSSDGLGSNDFDFYILVLVAAGLAFGASLALHIYKSDKTKNLVHLIAYSLKCVSFIFVTIAAIVGIEQFVTLRSWMDESNWFGEKNHGENTFRSFGQFMPLILLALPFLALLEEAFGNTNKGKSSDDDDSNKKKKKKNNNNDDTDSDRYDAP